MKKLVLAVLALLVLPGSASAHVMFGLSTESAQDFRAVQRQMPVQLWSPFIGFKRAAEFDTVLAQAKSFGTHPLITWEPWSPRTYANASRSKPQAGLSNQAIALGRQDAYLKRQARYVRSYRRTVYIRLAHEMNGDWYPWSRDAASYRRMWRHVWSVFHRMGVTNVRWIWSPNLNTYEDDAAFDAHARRYWPGARYVDIVGTTASRLLTQGDRYRDPAALFARIDRLRTYGKPVWITEAVVDKEEMAAWLPAFRAEIDARPWIEGVNWLSTTAPQNPAFGNINWSLADEPLARRYLTFD